MLEPAGYLTHQGYSLTTTRVYKHIVTKFKQAHEHGVDQLLYQDIVKYLSTTAMTKLSNNHKVHTLSAIKQYYDGLVFYEIRKDHPCRRLFLRSSPQSSIIESDLFSTFELELLLQRDERYEIIKCKNQVVISLLIYQGLTSMEIAQLKISDICLETGQLNIVGTKATKQRTLSLTHKQILLFEEYLYHCRPVLLKGNLNPYFAINLRGKTETSDSINYLIETFKPLFPNKILNAQKIRMSVIYNWLNLQKIPLEQVQIMAGHGLPSATMRYKACNISELRQQINTFHPL